MGKKKSLIRLKKQKAESGKQKAEDKGKVNPERWQRSGRGERRRET